MAEMLRDPDSTEKHLSITRRHIRLCNSMKGADFLSAAITPHHERLQATLVARENAANAEEDAQDDLELRGREAADCVRTLSERAKQYDRDMPGETVYQKLFPEGGYSNFISANGTIAAATATVFAKRIGELGAAHALASLTAEHTARALAMDGAQKVLDDAHRARKLAEAEEELAQAALRRAYESNWLDARKKFGKVIAERLFPRIRRRGGAEPTDTRGENGGTGGTQEPT